MKRVATYFIGNDRLVIGCGKLSSLLGNDENLNSLKKQRVFILMLNVKEY